MRPRLSNSLLDYALGTWPVATTSRVAAGLTSPADRRTYRGRRSDIFVPRPGTLSAPPVISWDKATGNFGVVLVEAARNLAPVDARERLAPQVRLMRQLMGESAVLVIVPWLSPRTREVLETNGFGYLDLTGNISFRLRRPLVFLRQLGADRDPNPPSRGRHGLAGARAGNLVRLLVDVAPPYRAGELAAASGISLPWVGRLLEAMEAQALIRRDGRTVVDTDWVGLLRERAATIDLLKMNNAVPMVAPAGIPTTLERLARPDISPQVAVTGSLAARAIAPRAVGGQLMLYVRGATGEPYQLARQLQLIPAERGADVVLLRPPNDVVFQGLREVDGVPHVALSQLTIDCLSGNGRMPAEGEALIEYMTDDESRWRRASLPEHSAAAAGLAR